MLLYMHLSRGPTPIILHKDLVDEELESGLYPKSTNLCHCFASCSIAKLARRWRVLVLQLLPKRVTLPTHVVAVREVTGDQMKAYTSRI